MSITTHGCLTGGTAESAAFRQSATLHPDRPGGGATGTAVISSRVQVGAYEVFVTCADGGGTAVVIVIVLPSGHPVPPPVATIIVTPMYVRPGATVDLRVTVCDPGTVAVSPAFAWPVRLWSSDGVLHGIAKIGSDTPPGAYEVFAGCEDATATGTVVVVGTGSRKIPSGGVNTGFGGTAHPSGTLPLGTALTAGGLLLGAIARRRTARRPAPAPRRRGLVGIAGVVLGGMLVGGCSDGSGRTVSAVAQASPVSEPVRVDVPAIGAHSTLVPLGLDRNGAIAVPPLSEVGQAGWYAGGPAPGEKGAAVIVGHVDSKAGPGVFHDLSKLKRGDTVEVTLRNGRTEVFAVESVQEFPKDRFPTQKVYGAVDYPALRLITCGGAFDGASGHYVDNVVAFARLSTAGSATPSGR